MNSAQPARFSRSRPRSTGRRSRRRNSRAVSAMDATTMRTAATVKTSSAPVRAFTAERLTPQMAMATNSKA